MSGHSHWANIKRKKEAQDKKKSAAFSKAAKLILTAIKEGGINPDTNNALRLAIAYAKQVKMPNSNIERLIKKQSNKDSGQYKEYIYEALYHNIPILIRALTNNTNRTINDLKQVLNVYGARLVEKGAVSWQFSNVGLIKIALQEDNVEELELKILDLIEAIDFKNVKESNQNLLFVYVAKDKLKEYTNILQKANLNVIDSRLFYNFTGAKPEINNDVKDKLLELKEQLLSIDDVTDIWAAIE